MFKNKAYNFSIRVSYLLCQRSNNKILLQVDVEHLMKSLCTVDSEYAVKNKCITTLCTILLLLSELEMQILRM